MLVSSGFTINDFNTIQNIFLVSNYIFIPVLLNWLICFTADLQNIKTTFKVTTLDTLAPPKTEGQLDIYRQVKQFQKNAS